MKRTLFIAIALCGGMPAMAVEGMTLPGQGIANDCTWNLFATFDKIDTSDSLDYYTGLATVNFGTDGQDVYYVVGYKCDKNGSIALGMANHATTEWIDLGTTVANVSSDSPLSFALSHNGSNEGGDNSLTLHLSTGTYKDKTIDVNSTTAEGTAESHESLHITTVTLGTAMTSSSLLNHDGETVYWSLPTSGNFNLTAARLEHDTYSDAAFIAFIRQQQPWDAGTTLRYTTTEGSTTDTYAYGTPNGEVTFNPSAFTDNKLTLDKTIDLTARTTFIVDDGKTVEISGAKTFTGADQKTHEKGSAFGNGELVKSGGGTLAIRLNDTNRDIDVSVDNDYEGSVTVEEGTLYLFHKDYEEPCLHIARLGGGEDTVITVKEGATLEMGAQTQISIPLGAHAGDMKHGHNLVIDGGGVHVHADTEYGIPEVQTETSTIKDVKITQEGLDQVDPEVRAQLIVNGITVYDARENGGVEFKHADIITDDFYYNGHTTIRNTNLWADEVLMASAVGRGDEGDTEDSVHLFSLEVVDHSHVVYGAGADHYSSGAWGHVDNVHVDKTSKLQTASNELEHGWGGALQIQGECTLDVADVALAGEEKGLAQRQNGTVEGVLNGETLTLTDIRYTTDQLSGDMLAKWHDDVYGTLHLNLKDPSSALPLNEEGTLKNTVFTLTLTNFDSSLLVKDAYGNLDPEAANLTIDAYEGTEWHLIYGRYDKETNNSIFTFSTMENLKLAPEPATATLSLLALAGLMARRRRH